MVLKEIGTYNSLWMMAVWNAHLTSKRLKRRMQVRMIPTFVDIDDPVLTWYPTVRPTRNHAPAR